MAEHLKELLQLARASFPLALKQKAPEGFSLPAFGFGGLPYMTGKETWPECGRCANPLDFICQGNISALVPPPGFDYFTFFYCFECNPLGTRAFDAKAWALRSYKKPALEKWQPPEIPENQVTLPCEVTPGEEISLPDWHSLQWMAPSIAAFYQGEDGESRYEAVIESVLEPGGFTFTGGYPQWIEGDHTPLCREGEPMDQLMQIDSEEEADLIWGDSGCCYLFYCPKHAGEFGLRIQF